MAKKTVEDLINAFTQLESELLKDLPDIVKEYAQSANALVIHDIQQGVGVNGKQYSTRPMLATMSVFLQKNKFEPDVIATTLGRDASGRLIRGGDRTKKGNVRRNSTDKRLRWLKFRNARKAVPVMTLPGGYKQLRAIQGLQTAKVDLTYTGRMILNIKVLNTENKSEFKVIAVIGGVNEETKKKLIGNFKRYGDFLAITPNISKVVNEIPINRIRELLKKHLG